MIGKIEDAIIARINAAKGTAKTLGYEVPTVESYGGQLTSEGLPELVKKLPAILVAFAGEGKPMVDARGEIATANFMLFCATRSYRNEEAARRGAAGQVGAYQLYKDGRALLRGQTLGLDITPIQVGRVEPVYTSKTKTMQLTVYGVHFSTAYALDEAVPATALNDFISFHSDWDIPPTLTPNEVLPMAAPDSSDTLTVGTI